MRVLITGDWHTEWSNIDQCKRVWKYIVDACKKHKLEHIILCGDLKSQYNPVDIRSIRFWMDAVCRARDLGIGVIVVLGNHDRIGQHDDAQNWLPIFLRAGAKTFDKPDAVACRDGSRIFVLPFDSSPARWRGSADKLLERKPDKEKDILVFHANLKGCQFNVLGGKSDNVLRPKDLHPSRYRYCIGGDVHMPQEVVKGVFYCGSPFPMDWGEANQQKHFALVTNAAGSSAARLSFLPSPEPGWYDPQLPGYKSPSSWKGAHIRIRVRCTVDENYNRTLAKARRAAERIYRGAYVHCEPEFADQGQADVKFDSHDPDIVKLATYVRETLPPELDEQEKSLVSYLAYQLNKAGGAVRQSHGVKFIKAEADNFLSFKHLEIDYTKSGIVVVEGKNRDWHGRSNGSGKTNYLQPIPVALFNSTFKGQKHDKWARRGCSKRARVRLYFEAAAASSVMVDRRRRPSKLKLVIGNTDQSSGNRPSSKKGTQGLLEIVSGFTWQTLANAVYIDQSVTRAFLGGTKKERTEVLSKFQNLERFERALALVRTQKSKLADQLTRVEKDIAVCYARINECQDAQKGVKRAADKELRKVRREWLQASKASDKANKQFKIYQQKSKAEQERCHRKADKYDAVLAKKEKSIEKSSVAEGIVRKTIHNYEQVMHLGTCPTCYQAADRKLLKRSLKKAKKVLAEIVERLTAARKKRTKLLNKQANLDSRFDLLKIQLADESQRVKNLDLKAGYVGQRYNDLKRSDSSAKKSLRKYRNRLRTMLWKKQALKNYRRELEKSQARLIYCERTFSRDGIPAFLNQQLVPVLNKASEFYAKLFGDNHIQVRFKVEDGEFEPVILNASGGETLDDQSVGEKALAGLITSFALREVAPTCNLLILDEPGDGLDAVNARKFAQALPQLKDRFGTIMVTTHNPYILAELSGERKVVIEKRNRISRVV